MAIPQLLHGYESDPPNLDTAEHHYRMRGFPDAANIADKSVDTQRS